MSAPNSIDENKGLYQDLLRQIEAQLGWPPSSEWQHGHFQHLSDAIFEKTQVQLSVVTLKRIWGKVSYNSKPSLSTLDTLAQFGGYEHWLDYQQKQRLIPTKVSQARRSDEVKPYFQKLGLFLIGLIILFSVIAFSRQSWFSSSSLEDVKFDFKPVSLGIPNTINFTYEVPTDLVDSVFIQQSWDPALRHKVDKNANFFACTYYYPGFYTARLVLNDKAVRYKALHIKTDGWMGIIEKGPVPFYLDSTEIYQANKLEISAEHLLEKGYDLNGEIPTTSLHLVDDFNVSGDNFRFETRFRHTMASGEAVCQQVRILLLHSTTPFIIPFSIKGCVGELSLMLPDTLLEGQNSDLTAFGVDFSDWVDLSVEAKDGKIQIFVNSELAYEGPLSQSDEAIAGIRFQFHGTGEVDYVNLVDENRSLVKADFQR